MPRINSYPTVTPTTSDLLLMSDVSATDNSTKTCTISDVVALSSGGIQPIELVTTSISTAQISTLYTSPVVVVPAPGAGKFIKIINIVVDFTYGTATITGQRDLYFFVDTVDTGDVMAANSVLPLGGTVTIRRNIPILNDGTIAENTAAVLTNNPAGGVDPTMNGSTSTMKVYINYISETI